MSKRHITQYVVQQILIRIYDNNGIDVKKVCAKVISVLKVKLKSKIDDYDLNDLKSINTLRSKNNKI